MGRFSPTVLPSTRTTNVGEEIARAIDQFRFTRRQEEQDVARQEERDRSQAFRDRSIELQEEAAERAERRGDIENFERGFRRGVPPGSPGITEPVLDRGFDPSDTLDRLRVGRRGPEELPEDEGFQERPIRDPGQLPGATPGQGGGVSPIRVAGQRFYSLPGGGFIDPSATPGARRREERREEVGAERAFQLERDETRREFDREIAGERRTFTAEGREDTQAFQRGESQLGREAALELEGLRQEGRRTTQGDPRTKERRAGLAAEFGKPQTELQQDILDEMAKGTTPEQVIRMLEQAGAPEATLEAARDYVRVFAEQ